MEGFVLQSPGGEKLNVTKEMFSAFQVFMRDKPSGEITVTFHDGGITRVETSTRKVYSKNGQ